VSCSGRWPRNPALWRTLDEIGPTQRGRIGGAWAKTHAHVWKLIEQRHRRIPPSHSDARRALVADATTWTLTGRVNGGDFRCLDRRMRLGRGAY
jgi:hypothetical protein